MLKVAQIAPLFESVPPKLYGGTERVIDNLARGLAELDVDVTVFCSGDSSHEGRLESVWPEALRLSKKKIVDPVAYQARMLEYVALRAKEFDVIHNHYDYGLLPLSRRINVPMLTTMHYRMDVPDLPAIFEYYEDTPLVSISDSQRKPMPQLNWMTTIYHGLDASTFTFHPRPGEYLAFLGRFSPEKGAHLAIEIARRAGVPLKLAAKINPEEMAYYDAVVKPHIDGAFIEYVGEISEKEKSQFLGQALALVNPIDWPEPFGLVMIEAMACGTPVLTRPVGSAPEVVENGLTGFLKSDIFDLAESVPEAAQLDRAKIRRRFEERFSVERMTREYLNAYRQLIAGQVSTRSAGVETRPKPPKIHDKSAHPRRVADHRRHFLHPVDGARDGDLQGIA